MHCIEIDPERAVDALELLAGHLPLGMRFGQPVVALNGQVPGEVVFLATDASCVGGACVWFVGDGDASRLVGLVNARCELTTFVRGVETDRVVKHERDMDLPRLP